jgi:hypothetical protein
VRAAHGGWAGMSALDLYWLPELPNWATSPEDFLKKHR